MAAGLLLEERWPSLYPLAKGFELLGQRALVYTIALVIAGSIAWSARQWRPVVVTAASLLALNVAVGSAKLLTGRSKPVTGELGLFDGGVMFPSGHAVNVVVAWGLVCYLLVRYTRRRYPQRAMAVTVALASLAMAAASVYLNTHWVTDLLAGWIVGAMLLQGTVMVDAAVARGGPIRQAHWVRSAGLYRRPRTLQPSAGARHAWLVEHDMTRTSIGEHPRSREVRSAARFSPRQARAFRR